MNATARPDRIVIALGRLFDAGAGGPRAVICHLEGATAGTLGSSGTQVVAA